jgi:hypothetical protein
MSTEEDLPINTEPEEEELKLPADNEQIVIHFGRKAAALKDIITPDLRERIWNDFEGDEETLRQKASGYYRTLLARGALSEEKLKIFLFPHRQEGKKLNKKPEVWKERHEHRMERKKLIGEIREYFRQFLHYVFHPDEKLPPRPRSTAKKVEEKKKEDIQSPSVVPPTALEAQFDDAAEEEEEEEEEIVVSYPDVPVAIAVAVPEQKESEELDEEIDNSLTDAMEQAAIEERARIIAERHEEDCCVCLLAMVEAKSIICDQCLKPLHQACLEKCLHINDYGVEQIQCPHCRTELVIIASGEQTPVEVVVLEEIITAEEERENIQRQLDEHNYNTLALGYQDHYGETPEIEVSDKDDDSDYQDDSEEDSESDSEVESETEDEDEDEEELKINVKGLSEKSGRTTAATTPKSKQSAKKSENRESELYETLPISLDALFKCAPDFLAKYKTIFECCDGKGAISNYLKNKGFTVHCSDKYRGENRMDFLNEEPSFEYDAIITNPPYAKPNIGLFVSRCLETRKPFALLIPLYYVAYTSMVAKLKDHSFKFIYCGSHKFRMENGVIKDVVPFGGVGWLVYEPEAFAKSGILEYIYP